MPSKLGTHNAFYFFENEDIVALDYHRQHKQKSPQQQRSKNSKETQGSSSSMKLQEKDNIMQSGKLIKPTSLDEHASKAGKNNRGGSIPPMRLRNYQKPWPSGKSSRSEELVKHMSNIPSYLQRVDGPRGDNLQENALNVGVLNWGHLEQWTHGQKTVAKERGGCSPTSTAVSSPFSTCGSSTKPRRSSSSPSSQERQCHSPSGGWSASDEGCQTRVIEEGSSTDSMHKHEKVRRKASVPKPNFCNMTQHQGDGSSPLKVPESFCSRSNREKVQFSTPKEAKKIECNEVKDGHGNLSILQDWPLEECLAVTKEIEGVWDHLQGSVTEKQSSSVSTAFKDQSAGQQKSGSFPPEDVHFFTDIFLQVPHSCPLPPTIESDEPVVASTSACGSDVPTSVSKYKLQTHDLLTSLPCELFDVSRGDGLVQDLTKASSVAGRGLSPSHQSSAGLNWMCRSSSLRENSPKRQMKGNACSDNVREEKANENSRARRSPLRRMLDPLLKPMNRIHFSGPISRHHVHERENIDKPSIKEESKSVQGPRKSTDENGNSSPQPHGSLQEEKHSASTRHALLQLAWKNGLPMFMFSSNDSDILAATIQKRNDSMKGDGECIYTVFVVREVKKKSGIWMKNSGKSKNQELVSLIIGQIKVSGPKLSDFGSDGYSFMREFVFFGAELTPASHENVGMCLNNELGAVIVKDRCSVPESSHCHKLQNVECGDSIQKYSEDSRSNYQTESLKTKLDADGSNLFNILAILPTSIHGMPAEGEPSPLVERWKSGGSCDCGGWDEGCMLTILCDKLHGSNTSHFLQAHGGTQRIDLFAQSRFGEKKHTFSMVAFKEGLYTVDFEESIAVSQAFAICVAALHNSKPLNHSEVHCSLEGKREEDYLFANHAKTTTERTKEKVPASYIPNHPPLSPFGRA